MVELKIKKDDTEINVMDKTDVESALDDKVDKETGKGLFSGSYNDLTNKPTIPSAYTHPSEKQCNYSYSHPSAKQCDATIPSASSSTPSADVSGGAIGSSSNYAKADHQHPLSSAYATSGHNHSGTYAPVSHNQALSTISDADTEEVLVTYTDSTTETLHLVIWRGATIVTNVVLTTDSALSNPSFTATVTNSKGNGITGKTVTFYVNNTSMGTGTTNSNGVATYTYQGYALPMSQYKATCDGVDSNIINV